jgi:hypothetical protein
MPNPVRAYYWYLRKIGKSEAEAKRMVAKKFKLRRS